MYLNVYIFCELKILFEKKIPHKISKIKFHQNRIHTIERPDLEIYPFFFSAKIIFEKKNSSNFSKSHIKSPIKFSSSKNYFYPFQF